MKPVLGCVSVHKCSQVGITVCAHACVYACVSRHCTNSNPFEEWKAQRMERQSQNFTGVQGKLP